MAKNKPTLAAKRWYNQHYWALLLALGSLVITYAIGSRSLDTGSWQQYGLTLVFGIFGLNRLGHAAHTTAKSLWSMLPNRKG